MNMLARAAKYPLILVFALSVSVSLSIIYDYLYNSGSVDPGFDQTDTSMLFVTIPFFVFYLMFLFGDKILYWIGGILVAPSTVLAFIWLASSLPRLFTGNQISFELPQVCITAGPIVLGPLLGRLSRPLLRGPWGAWFGGALMFLGALVVVGGVYSAISLSLRPASKPIIPQGIQINTQTSNRYSPLGSDK